MSLPHLQTEALSHARKVRSLYKRALRNIFSEWGTVGKQGSLAYRYRAVVMRARFDEHKDQKDFIKAKQLLLEGEEELKKKLHFFQFKFPTSPGGTAYDRYPPINDAILDMWHPSEKALYPDYFARRDIRKREFIERWHKKYGHPDHHHHDDH